MGIGMVKERHDFGDRQVKQVSEIKMGKMYKLHQRITTETIIPIRRSDMTGWIKVKRMFNREPITDEDIEATPISDFSLADCGIIPYEKDIWNETNWLEKIEEK